MLNAILILLNYSVSKLNIYLYNSLMNFFNITITSITIITFSYLIIFFIFYMDLLNINSLQLYSQKINVPNIIDSYKIDLFGLVILFLVYIVGYLSMLSLDSRVLKKNNIFILIFNYFIYMSYVFVTCFDTYTFLMVYELFLLPSSVIVYLISPSRKSIDATKYFLM